MKVEKSYLLSIIIPVYNVESYISDCLESILNQSFNNYEIVIVDDGSTDLSPEICIKYKIKFDNIKFIKQSNGGVALARNNGLKIATGEYIWFVDADDIVSRNSLSIINTVVSNNCNDIILFDYVKFEKFSINEYNFKDFPSYSDIRLSLNNISSYFSSTVWNYLYKKSFLISNQLWFKENQYYEDAYFNIMVFTKINKIRKVNEVIYFYRIRSLSKTTKNSLRSFYKRIDSQIDLINLCKEYKVGSYFYNKIYGYENNILIFINKYLILKGKFNINDELYILLNKELPNLSYKCKSKRNILHVFLYNFHIKIYFYIILLIKRKNN